MKYSIAILIFLCTLSFSTPKTRADFVISLIPSAANFTAGESGHVDVMIYSTAGDALDSFLFGLNISGGPGVIFRDPQSDSFLSLGNYVFAGRSSNVFNSLPATLVGSGGSSITVGDITYDPGSLPPGDPLPFVVPGSATPSLLARIEFETLGVGNFQIDVDPSSTFSDVDFNNFDFSSSGASFTVSAVPEPSSFVLLTVALGGAGTYFRRRKRLQQSRVAQDRNSTL